MTSNQMDFQKCYAKPKPCAQTKAVFSASEKDWYVLCTTGSCSTQEQVFALGKRDGWPLASTSCRKHNDGWVPNPAGGTNLLPVQNIIIPGKLTPLLSSVANRKHHRKKLFCRCNHITSQTFSPLWRDKVFFSMSCKKIKEPTNLNKRDWYHSILKLSD